MGLMVPSSVIRIEAGRAPTWGRNLNPSAFSFSANCQTGPKAEPLPAATRGVTVQPVVRVMCSIQASSSGSFKLSETNSMAPKPSPEKALPMVRISSPEARVPGTRLPALSMCP